MSGNCKDCNSDCNSCNKAGSCNHKKPEKLKTNKNSQIKNIIGVVSGKGGVGKSLVCGLLASKLKANNFNVGILDADVTGPSVPKMFGVQEQLKATETAMIAAENSSGIKMVSANLILDNPESPVAWRGPVVTGAISQFFNMTDWGNLDYLLIDMPPGTSDVFLTVLQMIPVNGIVCVTTPQDLVEMIVGKAINLAKMLNVEVISLVENMSYFKCPDCNKKYEIFGTSKVDEVAKKHNIAAVDKLAIDPKFAQLCDEGKIDQYDVSALLDNTFKAVKE